MPSLDEHISPDESVSQSGSFGREVTAPPAQMPTTTETPTKPELPVLKDDNLTEEDAASTVTESSGSLYVSFAGAR